MPNSDGGIGGVGGEGERDGRRRQRSPPPPPPPDHPYEYIMIPGGGRFDIPEGEDKEEWIQFFEKSARVTREHLARCGNRRRPADGINLARLLPDSTHRDGAVYRVTGGWRKNYRIFDTHETQLEAGALSNPSNCRPNRENCRQHFAQAMMQIFSIELGKLSMDSGPVQIYGYIAIRDSREPLRNYVFNRSRVDPITLEQGSPIEMIGPKRGIDMSEDVLIEFDMKIKKGEQELDDVQLIDGVKAFGESTTPFRPFLSRIGGVGGVVDITLAMFNFAVESTIEVNIAQVYGSGFHMVLTCLVSGLVVEKEIQLFDGVVSRPCGLRRFVIALKRDALMHLKFKFVDDGGIASKFEHCASFKAKCHGYDMQQLQHDEASIMVKVTWSTLCSR